MTGLKLVLAIASVIFFGLSGFGVAAKVNWDGLGKACAVAAFFLPV